MKYRSEIWKIIEDFPAYKISNLGRVFSIKNNESWGGVPSNI